MLGVLGVSSVVVGLFCGIVVIINIFLWFASNPPVLTPGSLPPVLRRGMYWWLGATVFFAIAAIAWVLLRKPLGISSQGTLRYAPLVLGIIPLLVVNPIYFLRRSWVRRSALAAEWQLCTHCAYDVSGLEPAGTCPECGKPYDTHADRHLWSAFDARATPACVQDDPTQHQMNRGE